MPSNPPQQGRDALDTPTIQVDLLRPEWWACRVPRMMTGIRDNSVDLQVGPIVGLRLSR
jgi:hypothetical protein